MPVAISNVLRESREYYRKLKRELVGQLAINARGSLVRKQRRGHPFLYLRRSGKGGYKDIYLCPENDQLAPVIVAKVEERKMRVEELRKAKKAMKELKMHASEIREEDYFPTLKTLFFEFEKHGLWDAGFELIGSWCFKIYQNYCGVAWYPERTMDVDFAITVPYAGNPVSVAACLKELGFQEEINYADGCVSFKSVDFKVEFLKDRKRDGAQRKEKSYISELGLEPQALPYLRILLENSMEIKGQDIGRIKVPSLPAFMLHKLLVADERKKLDKKEKDYRQVDAVAVVIAKDLALQNAVNAIANSIHKKWLKKLIKSAKNLPQFHPRHSGAVDILMRAIVASHDEILPRGR